MTTYNTGKVQIGLLYQGHPRPYHDKDALLLQRCLLSRHSHRSQNVLLQLVRNFWAWC